MASAARPASVIHVKAAQCVSVALVIIMVFAFSFPLCHGCMNFLLFSIEALFWQVGTFSLASVWLILEEGLGIQQPAIPPVRLVMLSGLYGQRITSQILCYLIASLAGATAQASLHPASSVQYCLQHITVKLCRFKITGTWLQILTEDVCTDWIVDMYTKLCVRIQSMWRAQPR